VPSNYTTKFDDKFAIISHFAKFPQMVPFVGNLYEDQKNRVLFIGESCYLPDESTIHHTSSKWYNSTINDLNPDEIGWSKLRDIINYAENQDYQKEHSILKNIELSILDSGFNPPDKKNMFKYISFYNYFQRPALRGVSIVHDQKDDEVSDSVFRSVIEILSPDIVCFMSSRIAWYAADGSGFISKNNGVWNLTIDKKAKCDFFPHPSCSWWNRKSKEYDLNDDKNERTGKEKLVEFLSTNNVFCE